MSNGLVGRRREEQHRERRCLMLASIRSLRGTWRLHILLGFRNSCGSVLGSVTTRSTSPDFSSIANSNPLNSTLWKPSILSPRSDVRQVNYRFSSSFIYSSDTTEIGWALSLKKSRLRWTLLELAFGRRIVPTKLLRCKIMTLMLSANTVSENGECISVRSFGK